MKRKVLAGGLLGLSFTAAAFALPVTKVQYQATNIGSGRWQYSYDVTNISLTPAIEEFTIWFDYGLYDNLSIETPTRLRVIGMRLLSSRSRCWEMMDTMMPLL